MKKQSYRTLFVWRAAMDVAVVTAGIADQLCARRRFALADQMQRSSISIPSNIAEGHGRRTPRDQRHFFTQARGSTYELETQLELAVRIAGIQGKEVETVEDYLAKIGAGLTKMIDRQTAAER